MSNSIVQSFAKQSGKTTQEVEKLWNEIVDSTKKSHPKMTEKDDDFYKIVVGSLKKALKIQTEESQATTTTASLGSDAIYAKKMSNKKTVWDRMSDALNKKIRNEGTVLEHLGLVLEESTSISSAKLGDIIKDNKGNFYTVLGNSNKNLYASPVKFDSGEVEIIGEIDKDVSIQTWDPMERSKYRVVARKGTYKYKEHKSNFHLK